MAETNAPAEAVAPPCERVAGWESIPGLVHGFFGRSGGCSSGPFASLNLSAVTGDAGACVARNWQALQTHLGVTRLVRMTQVHGSAICAVGEASLPADAEIGNAGEFDGLITRVPGVGLVVLTADCVPILMVAPSHRAAMALHAGWRGTVAGIATAGLTAASDRLSIAPHEWHVALGPAIGGCCYEVETAIGERLVDRWGAMPDAWIPGRHRGQLDLRRANRAILVAHGVPTEQVADVGSCTACDNERYFSHRRSGGRTGRQAAVIGFNGKSLLSPRRSVGTIGI